MTRRAHSHQARIVRNVRATLSLHGLVVVNVQTGERNVQGLLGVKGGKIKSVQVSRQIARDISEMAHHWTVYLAVFCRDQADTEYIKSVEIAPNGQYRSDALAGAMEHHHAELRDTCNPAHIIGAGWIGCPSGRSFSESDAADVFESMGVWV